MRRVVRLAEGAESPSPPGPQVDAILSVVPPRGRSAQKKAGPRGPGKSNREASRLGDVKRVRRPGAPGRRPKQDDVALQHRSMNRYKFLAEIPPVNSAVEPCMWCMPGWGMGNPCKSTRWVSAARTPAGFRGPDAGVRTSPRRPRAAGSPGRPRSAWSAAAPRDRRSRRRSAAPPSRAAPAPGRGSPGP